MILDQRVISTRNFLSLITNSMEMILLQQLIIDKLLKKFPTSTDDHLHCDLLRQNDMYSARVCQVSETPAASIFSVNVVNNVPEKPANSIFRGEDYTTK